MTRTDRFDAAFLVRATGGRAEGDPRGARVVTDSRGDVTGAIFVALAGDRFDGHAFVGDVLGRGATGAVVSAAWREGDGRGARGPLVVVGDPLTALQDLAGAHRARMPVPLVAVTGSSGKTTVKELLAAALAPLGPILRTGGNRNNHIGVPLTLLDLDGGHAAGVVEMGMNHPGEIRFLATLVQPRVAVITNVAHAHLEGVGTRADVARAKAEIADGLAPGGVLVHPSGDEDLEPALAAYRGARVRFGVGPDADFRPAAVVPLPDGRRRIALAGGTEVETPAPGNHMVANVLAALAAARALGVAPEEAGPALAAAPGVPGRLEVKRARGIVILDDSYNANPASLAAALQVLRDWTGARRRVAVLADMLELGEASADLHAACGAAVAFVDRLITVGPLTAHLGEAAVAAGLDRARWSRAADGDEAGRLARAGEAEGDVVLVKGSRGMKLESAVRALAAAGTEAA